MSHLKLEENGGLSAIKIFDKLEVFLGGSSVVDC